MRLTALQNLSDSSVINAIEENLFESFHLTHRWSGAEVDDRPDLLSILTEIPFPIFNSLLCARLEVDSVDTIIETAIAQARSKGVPRLWWVTPSTQPVNLASSLESHGFVYESRVIGMAVDLTSMNQDLAIPSDLSISVVEDIDALKCWCHTSAIGFGMSDFEKGWFDWIASISPDFQTFRHYLGYWKGRPIATSSLFYGAGVAGIYNVSTLPEARNQGIGTAMVLLPLLKAQAMDYRVGILQSAEQAIHIYKRLGFPTLSYTNGMVTQ